MSVVHSWLYRTGKWRQFTEINGPAEAFNRLKTMVRNNYIENDLPSGVRIGTNRRRVMCVRVK